jgi:hypothetical protein
MLNNILAGITGIAQDFKVFFALLKNLEDGWIGIHRDFSYKYKSKINNNQ